MGAPEKASLRALRLAHQDSWLPKAFKGARDIQGWALEALARRSEAKPDDLQMMSEYRPRAACGDPTRAAVSPRAPIDGLGNYMSGSVGKPRISPLWDMTGAWNDRKPRVLMDSPASSTGAAILAIQAIVVTAHPNEGPKSPSTTREQWNYK